MTQSFYEFECKEQEDFESFMMRYKPEFRDFEKVGESTYSNTLTSIAYDSYLAGQQSKQAEIDELRKRIDEALDLIYKEKSAVKCDSYKGADADLIIGIGYELHKILKGNQND